MLPPKRSSRHVEMKDNTKCKKAKKKKIAKMQKTAIEELATKITKTKGYNTNIGLCHSAFMRAFEYVGCCVHVCLQPSAQNTE